MSQVFPSDDLLRLCAELAEGGIDDSQAAELRALLSADAQARDFYLRFMEVHGLLYLDYAAGATPTTMPGASSMPLASLTSPALGEDLFQSPTTGFDGISSLGPVRSSTTSLALAFGFGMAAMLLVGLSWSFLSQGPTAGKTDANASASVDRISLNAAVARVVKLDDPRWEESAAASPKVGDLVKAGPFQLRSGGVTLAFLGGVVLSLDGPTDLDLVASDRIFCRQGRLRARVPKQAEGFVIASPKSGASKIGSDFVLDVDTDGRARIQIYEGAAEDAARQTPAGPDRGAKLAQAAKPASETLKPPGGEKTATPTSGPGYPLELAPTYPALVRESHPIGYWRFNALENDGFPSEVAGSPPLRLTGAGHTQKTPRGNQYLVLPADRGEPFLETDAVLRLPQTPDHSVEFWFLSESRRHASLVGLLPARGLNPVGQEDLYLHSLLVELMAAQRQSTHKPNSVRLLLRSPNDPLRVDNVYSAQPYMPGRWHHVVAQTRDDSAELYLDGVLTGTALINPVRTPSLCQVVVGRRTPDPGDQNESRAFVGCLDELALYDHALAPSEIRSHLQAVNAPDAGR